MDAWGYHFRLGSTRAWFEGTATMPMTGFNGIVLTCCRSKVHKQAIACTPVERQPVAGVTLPDG